MNNPSDFVIKNGVLKEYKGTGGDVVIPEGVTKIGKRAFTGCSSMTSLTIPETVKEIGSEAFTCCENLSHVILPESMERIRSYAFSECTKLQSIVIPKGVTEIEEATFYACEELKSVVIPEGVLKIGEAAFLECYKLQSVVIPEGVLEIGETAFLTCSKLKNIIIPNSVTTIGESAFEAGAVLSAPILSIDSFAPSDRPKAVQRFAKCYLDGKVSNPNLIEQYMQYIRKNRKKLYDVALQDLLLLTLMLQEKIIPSDQFDALLEQTSKSGNAQITVMLLNYQKQNFRPIDAEKKLRRQLEQEQKIAETNILPVAVAKKRWRYKSMDDGTLCITGYKGDDVDVLVPKGIGNRTVTKIGIWAFLDSPVQHITLPEGITTIDTLAFESASQLKSIVIPSTVTEIQWRAFTDCTSLESIVIPEGVTELADRVFDGCSALKSLTLPKSMTKFEGCRTLSNSSMLTVYAPSDSPAAVFFSDKPIHFVAI